METGDGTTNIEMLSDVCYRVLKRVLGYLSQSPLCRRSLIGDRCFLLTDKVMNQIDHTVPGGLIGRGAPISWPLRSLDLIPFDFSYGLRLRTSSIRSKAKIFSN